MMLLGASGEDIANNAYLWVGVIGGVVTLMVLIFKGNVIWGFFRSVTSGAAKAAVNSAAVDVVELLRTEVGELRTQLAETRDQLTQSNARNADQALKIANLQSDMALLSRQITAEEPIRELALKIEGLTSKVTDGLNALLNRKEGEAA
jgi:hypothetical protein